MLRKNLLLLLCLPLFMSCNDNPIQLELEKAVSNSAGSRGGGLLAVSVFDHDRMQTLAVNTFVTGRQAGTESPLVERDTPYGIASITKTFVATLTLIYVQRDLLQLDVPIVDLIDDKSWISTRSLNKKFRRNFETVSIRNLLSHRSGFADYWDSNRFIKVWKKQKHKYWGPMEVFLHWAGKMKPICKVSHCFHYSDTNYIILGLFIEKKFGKRLHSLLREEIFNPLNMRCSWMYFEEDKPKHCKPVAHSYERNLDVTSNEMQSADWSGGGLYSTLEDQTTFFSTLFFSERLLSKKFRKEMLNWEPTNHNRKINYGLGMYRIRVDDNMTLIGHLGIHNAFGFLWEERDILFVGSLNQERNDAVKGLLYPIMETMDENGTDRWYKQKSARLGKGLPG